MQSKQKPCELILALDVPSLEEAKVLLNKIGPDLKWVKVGLQLFTKYGPSIVTAIADMGYQVFLDLKLHDIPNTVASAIKSLKGLPVGLLTLHTSGGPEMMKWAKEARDEISHPMKLIGVTVLTSMDKLQLESIGINNEPQNQVSLLAKLAINSGIDGLVSSPLELPLLRDELGTEPLLITPGIRPKDAEANEQKRIMTPKEASSLGASYIVVGRPIYKADDPQKALSKVLEDISITV